MRIRDLHPWRLSIREAIEVQERLRGRVRLRPLPQGIRLVAGADVGYDKTTNRMHAAVVVVSIPGFDEVERVTLSRQATWPYVPGLFSFRELPPLLAAFRKLRADPDVLLFDGQGIAHPRRFGLASHAGVLLGTPSVGCAKTRLVGDHGAVGSTRGSAAPLRVRGEVVGAVLRTRAGVKPLYVSPGHRCDVDSATALVLALCPRYRLPEPLRLAHRATAEQLERDRRRGR